MLMRIYANTHKNLTKNLMLSNKFERSANYGKNFF